MPALSLAKGYEFAKSLSTSEYPLLVWNRSVEKSKKLAEEVKTVQIGSSSAQVGLSVSVSAQPRN
jgi:hypothetical protein